MRKAAIATAILLLYLSSECIAQQVACGLSKMTETTTPVYPPIAKAAHVEGNVILLVTFKTTGEVDKIDIASGPKMFEDAATDYVKGWRANEYSGPRTCPIVITFHLLRENEKATAGFARQDLQHVTLNADTPILYSNPSSTVPTVTLPNSNSVLSDPNRIQQLYYEIPDRRLP
jgi:TonB family protein